MIVAIHQDIQSPEVLLCDFQRIADVCLVGDVCGNKENVRAQGFGHFSAIRVGHIAEHHFDSVLQEHFGRAFAQALRPARH